MTARREKAARYAAASESTVYVGRDAVGSTLVVRKGRGDGDRRGRKRLGVYRSDREAMAAILAAARAMRESKR